MKKKGKRKVPNCIKESIGSMLKPKSEEEIEQSKKDAFGSLDKMAENNPDMYVKHLPKEMNDGKHYALVFTKEENFMRQKIWHIKVVRYDPTNYVWGGTPGSWYARTTYFFEQYGGINFEPHFIDTILLDGGSN